MQAPNQDRMNDIHGTPQGREPDRLALMHSWAG